MVVVLGLVTTITHGIDLPTTVGVGLALAFVVSIVNVGIPDLITLLSLVP